MHRGEFIRSITLGVVATTIGQISCRQPEVKTTNGKKSLNTDYRDRDWEQLFLPLVTTVPSDKETILDLDHAELMGNPPQPWGFRYFREAHWVDGWTSPEGLAIHWTIDAPEAMECSFDITYSCVRGSEGSAFQIEGLTAGYVGYDFNGRQPLNHQIHGTIQATKGWLDGWRNFEKVQVPGTLQIPKGKSVISLSAISKPAGAQGAWHHFRPDTEISPQRFTAEALIAYTQKCIEKGVVFTINMCMYQDGSVSPVTLEQMKKLKNAIRA